MPSFVSIYENVVGTLLSQGIDLDAPGYNPGLVTSFIIPGTVPGPPSPDKTFVHHAEMGFMWDSQISAIVAFLPGVGSIMAAAAIAAAAGIPTLPPNEENPQLAGDGNPPLYFLRPIPPAIPNPGVSLAPVIGAVIDSVISQNIPPSGGPPVKLPPPALAVQVQSQWLSQTALLAPGRIFASMIAYDAAWINYITSAFSGL